MSHLSRRYTDFYYVEVEKKNFFGRKKKELQKRYYIRQSEKVLQKQEEMLHISIPRQFPNAIFPCEHEQRDFMSKKKSNHTHARNKRRNKARIKARKAK